MSLASAGEFGLVLDLDRTLVKTDVIDELLADTFQDIIGMDAQELRYMRAVIEARGGNYDSVRGLRELIGPAEVEAVLEEFHKRAVPHRHSLFEAGAENFLENYTGHLPLVIMTYGGKEWQLAKLRACGLDKHPYLITDTVLKTEVIASWYDAAKSSYSLPGSTSVKSIIFVDDKAVSFKNLPEDGSVQGLWYWPGGRQLLPSQKIGRNELPEGVKRVTSWNEVDSTVNRNT